MKTSFGLEHLPLKRHNLSVDGIRTAFWEAGEQNATPVILLHGFGGTHHGLLPLAMYLKDYHLFIPDLPGHGVSAIPREATVKILAEWFAAYVRKIHQQTGKAPCIVAHSFGSQVAFNACQVLEEEYRDCILMTPVPRVSMLPYLFGKSVNLVPSRLAINVTRNERMRYMRGAYLLVRHTAHNEALTRWISDESAHSPDKIAFNIAVSRQILDELAYDADGAQKGRFYCISGDNDRMVDASGMAFLQKTFGHDRFFVCQNTGHLMPIEAPEDTAALLRPLLPKA